MKKTILLLWAFLLSLGISHVEPLAAKEQRQNISLPVLEQSMTITYTPTTVAGHGKWQLMVVTPDGKIIKDEKNGKISLNHPPAGPLSFKIRGPLLQGPYGIIFYVVKRTDATPIDLTSLASNLSIRPSSGKNLLTIPNGYPYGNQASTVANDTAQVVVDILKP